MKGSHTYTIVVDEIRENKFIAMTHRKSTNRVFSFGREHGFYGRIYNQTVVPVQSITVSLGKDTTMVRGFCFTPQDGNSILSSVAATMHAVHGEEYLTYMKELDNMLFDEV